MNFSSGHDSLETRAYRIRRYALRMGEVQGQGYIGQALGYADVLAVAYCHAMKFRPDDPESRSCPWRAGAQGGDGGGHEPQPDRRPPGALDQVDQPVLFQRPADAAG